jgi:predicted P-loop ATPase
VAKDRNMRVILGGGGGEPPPWDGAPNPPDEGEPWKDIARDAKGRPLPTTANIGLLLARSEEWTLAYDEFSDRAIVQALPDIGAAKARRGELDDYHVACAVNWLALTHGCDAGNKAAKDGMVFAAKQKWFDPIKDYFRGLEWDGVRRVETWLGSYVGVADEAAWPLGRMWLISAVARAMRPGCKADYMLVLVGPQGARKTSVFESLCPDPTWFQPDLPDLHNKDAMQSLVGALIVNADEMSAFKRADIVELAKNFLTRLADRYRAPYKELFRMMPRRCVFAGTSNNRHVLNDPTGGRRFWPAEVGEIALDELRRDRDQLWAEAYAMFTDGAQWWPDREQEAGIATRNKETFTAHDSWSATIEATCARARDGLVTLREIFAALGFESEQKHGTAETRRITSVLIGMGWEQRGEREYMGKRERVWRLKA